MGLDQQEDREWLQSACALHYIQRWVIVPMRRPQSVMEHSYRVAVITDFLSRGSNLERTPLLQYAMYHDILETVTGDIPSPYKSAMHIEELDAAKRLQEFYFPDLGRLESEIKPTGVLLVKVADLVEAYCYSFLYMEEQFKENILPRLGTGIASYLDNKLLHPWPFGLSLKMRVNHITNVLTRRVPPWI